MNTHIYIQTFLIFTGTGDRFNGVDEELMRDLRQVFSRGQDGEYDGKYIDRNIDVDKYIHIYMYIYMTTHVYIYMYMCIYMRS
jgi:hypothetical protein